jgi:hypothetical protein
VTRFFDRFAQKPTVPSTIVESLFAHRAFTYRTIQENITGTIQRSTPVQSGGEIEPLPALPYQLSCGLYDSLQKSSSLPALIYPSKIIKTPMINAPGN